MTENLVHRSAIAGMLGGVGWMLFPLGIPVTEIGAEEGAPPTGAAALAYFALLLVLPAALLLAGLVGLRVRHRGSFGRLGVAGPVVSFLGVALMGTGNAVELVALATVGDLNAIGYVMTMVGYLLVVIGSPLLGVAVIRAGVLPSARTAGLALALVAPIDIGLFVLAGLGLGDDSESLFWFTVTFAYGLAFVVVATALRRSVPRTPALV